MKLLHCFQSTGTYMLQDVCYNVYEPVANELISLSPTDSTATTFQPLFLDFHRVHSLATHFFIRMWSESGATSGDFPRIVALVRSQYVFYFFWAGLISYCMYRVKLALRKESSREWHEVEADFLESDYRDVRDRQMEQLELEDDLLSKIPVRYVIPPQTEFVQL